MNPRAESWRKLPTPVFKIAAQALEDVWHGGCSALVQAEASGDSDLEYAVSKVYTSRGTLPHDCHPWSCEECGGVFEDFDSAYKCCHPEYEVSCEEEE